MNENTTTENVIEKSVSDYFTTDDVSGYGLIKITNEVLKDLGIDKILPGPMGYTYIKKGYIDGVKDTSRNRVASKDAIVWIEKYIAKFVSKSEEVTEVSE